MVFRGEAWLRRPWESRWEDAWGADSDGLEVYKPQRTPAPLLARFDNARELASLEIQTVPLHRTILRCRMAGSDYFRQYAVYMAPEDQSARCELALFLHCLPLLGFLDTRVMIERPRAGHPGACVAFGVGPRHCSNGTKGCPK